MRYSGTEPPSAEEERFVSVFEKGKLLGKSPAEALAQLLRNKGLTGATVAWDHEGMAQEVKDYLRDCSTTGKVSRCQ